LKSTAGQSEASHIRADDSGSRSRLLLVVEDDPATLAALRKIFSRLGWEVQSSTTVAGGLDLLRLCPQALILDLMLPDGDGLDVLRQVRAENLSIRVAITTGAHDGERLEAARRLGPDDLIRKPIELDRLVQAIGPARP